MIIIITVLVTAGIIGSMLSIAALNTIARFALDVPSVERIALATLMLSTLLLFVALAMIVNLN